MTENILYGILLTGAALCCLYYAAAILSAQRFRAGMQHPAADPSFAPPVSILKPVRGLDPEAYENFAGYCRLDYPEYEILFAVESLRDPAVPVIEQLQRDFPHIPITLVEVPERLGASAKVSKMARLAREARYDLLVISDSDVQVEPHHLRRVVDPFRDTGVGAVTCLYRGIPAPHWTAELEAVGAVTDFFAGVLLAREVQGVRFLLGATMAVRRSCLDEIGGFEAMADYYADDHELGARVAARGHRIEFASDIVATHYPAMNVASLLRHQLRWALTVRHARPWGHAGLVFTHGLPWAVAAALLAPSAVEAGAVLAVCAMLRLWMAWEVGVGVAGDSVVRRRWWMLPLRDAMGFGVWLASFLYNRIDWRGERYVVRRGRLVPAASRVSRG